MKMWEGVEVQLYAPLTSVLDERGGQHIWSLPHPPGIKTQILIGQESV
jgi:hypothetical protein